MVEEVDEAEEASGGKNPEEDQMELHPSRKPRGPWLTTAAALDQQGKCPAVKRLPSASEEQARKKLTPTFNLLSRVNQLSC